MVIDQRNAGATGTTTGYTVDRFGYFATQASKFTWGQNLNSVTPPVGFSNYLGFQSSSAYSVIASDYFALQQRIEGFNTADLGFGTVNAKNVTLGFQVYSSLTGTFGGALQNSNGTRSYPFTYTVSVANTWTTVFVTIPGDTTGTWVGATNGIGAIVTFSLGAGSNNSGTAGAWASANYTSATGAISVVGTNNATFYITGIQLEVGSQASGFEYRQYGTELALCQRYFNFANMSLGGSTSSGVTNQYFQPISPQMRTTPTFTQTAVSNNNCTGSTISPQYPSLISFSCIGSAAGGFIGASAGSLSAEL
jgi:hypothetical protein